MDIIYNKPFEVTKDQFFKLMNIFSGIVAGIESEGKYYIKVLLMKYEKQIKGLI